MESINFAAKLLRIDIKKLEFFLQDDEAVNRGPMSRVELEDGRAIVHPRDYAEMQLEMARSKLRLAMSAFDSGDIVQSLFLLLEGRSELNGAYECCLGLKVGDELSIKEGLTAARSKAGKSTSEKHHQPKRELYEKAVLKAQSVPSYKRLPSIRAAQRIRQLDGFDQLSEEQLSRKITAARNATPKV